MTITELFTEHQLSQMTPSKGLRASTKALSFELERKGFSVIPTKEGWFADCPESRRKLVCDDGVLFMEELP